MLSYGISGSERKDKNRKLSRKLKKTTGLKGQNADTAQNTFGSVQNSLPAYRVAQRIQKIPSKCNWQIL